MPLNPNQPFREQVGQADVKEYVDILREYGVLESAEEIASLPLSAEARLDELGVRLCQEHERKFEIMDTGFKVGGLVDGIKAMRQLRKGVEEQEKPKRNYAWILHGLANMSHPVMPYTWRRRP